MSYYPGRREYAQAMRNCQSVTRTSSSEPYHYPSAWNECSTAEQQLLEPLRCSQPYSPPSNSNSISSLDIYPPTPATSPPLSLTKHAHHNDAMKNIDLTTGQAIVDPNELRKGPLRISSPNFHESLSIVYVHSPYCELSDREMEAEYNYEGPVGVNTAEYPPPLEEMDAEFLQLIVECAISADPGSADDTAPPFHADDSTLYVFCVFSLNDGQAKYYDGTLNEIWRQLFTDVKDAMREAVLGDDCVAMVSGEGLSFELLLSEREAEENTLTPAQKDGQIVNSQDEQDRLDAAMLKQLDGSLSPTQRTRVSPPQARRTPCKFFARGSCKRGAECWYSHDGGSKQAAGSPVAVQAQPYPHPSHWVTQRFGQLYYLVEAPAAASKQVTQALFASCHDRCFQQRLKLPRKPTVARVLQVENPQLWYSYQRKREYLREQHAHYNTSVRRYLTRPDLLPGSSVLDVSLNEIYAFHGTKKASVDDILAVGLDARQSKLSGLYGAGVYFADQACKSLQYTDVCGGSKHEYSGRNNGVLVLCRVTLGAYHVAEKKQRYAEIRRAPGIPGSSDFYDSVVAERGVANGGRQAHREFVVYDNAQAYPEYVIFFNV